MVLLTNIAKNISFIPPDLYYGYMAKLVEPAKDKVTLIVDPSYFMSYFYDRLNETRRNIITSYSTVLVYFPNSNHYLGMVQTGQVHHNCPYTSQRAHQFLMPSMAYLKSSHGHIKRLCRLTLTGQTITVVIRYKIASSGDGFTLISTF